MVWYYAEEDRQRGPLSDEEFQELVTKGRVRNETLIWKDGMDSWQPFKDAREAGLLDHISPAQPVQPGPYIPSPTGTPSMGTSTVTTPPSGSAQAAADSTSGSYCSQCSRGPLGVGDGVKLGNVIFCRQCDADMQRHYQQKAMTQQAAPGWTPPAYGVIGNGALTLASIFSRAAAKIIDNIICSVAIVLVMVTTSDLPGVNVTFQDFLEGSSDVISAMRPWILGSLIISFLYDALLVGAFGATLGKMALGIRVVSADGNRVTWNQAFIRGIAPIVLQLPALVAPQSMLATLGQFALIFGYVIAVADIERRTLYDRIAGTRVVR